MADDASSHPDILNATAQGQLKSIIERIERLEVEKGEVAEQIKEVKAEAKGNGFDVKIINKVVRIRKQDRAKRGGRGHPRPLSLGVGDLSESPRLGLRGPEAAAGARAECAEARQAAGHKAGVKLSDWEGGSWVRWPTG